jgi:transcriptional regulator GlxA family with amidase domain
MTRRIGFFVPEEASLLGLDCALDTLRVANRHLGRPFYEWCTIGHTNLQIKSSNGLKLTLDHLVTDVLPHLDMLFVCATVDTSSYVEREVFAWLRRMAGRVAFLGGITSGALILARAGLMKGYTFTIHWEDADAIQREFPQVQLSNSIFVIDRDRMTSAGGLVTIDLFLHIIARGTCQRL